ncbi:hypothetical protein LFZ32_11210 [Salmonella enterica subsp. enterica serovar Newport str. L0167]|nr:hypothetical protein LFZ32_11210 [Salmonella enterica subsp. enterica serovar Newport str. L0167]
MGHKVLLPVDGDVVNIKIFAFSRRIIKRRFFINFSGKSSRTDAAKNCFSIYRANAVVMTAPEAQFKRL